MNNYTRLIKTYKKNYVSVCIHLNVVNGCKYYDIVVYRRIKKRDGTQEWVRGANLKPTDLEDTIELMNDAQSFLKSII